MKHGDTRACTKCGAELWWNADDNTWRGEHDPDCYVGKKPAAAMPARVRTVGDDETDYIGATGLQEWRVTMQMGAPGGRFEEVIHVHAETEDGAILLGQESRLNIAGIIAEAIMK